MTDPRALDGLRVLDLAQYVPGAFAATLLADMGADVIRIDRAPLTPAPEPEGVHHGVSRGKRSLAIDLKNPAALEVAMRLVERADVLIEGFRPGMMERLGLGPDVVLDRNPRLVYARLTGWGQTGPLADRAGHDINYLAISGALGATGRAEERPTPAIPPLADFAGGSLMCAFGIVCALQWRERTGQGQVIDAAMVDSVVNMMGPFFAAAAAGTWGPRGTNLLDGGAPFYEVYETSDHRHVSVGAIEPKFYGELIAGLGLTDEDLPAQMDSAHWPDLKRRFTGVFRSKTLAEWRAVFDDTDACVFPVLTLEDVASHPHHAARASFERGPGCVVRPVATPRLSRSPASSRGTTGLPGEHTLAILAEIGLDAPAVQKLLAEGVVTSSADAPV